MNPSELREVWVKLYLASLHMRGDVRDAARDASLAIELMPDGAVPFDEVKRLRKENEDLRAALSRMSLCEESRSEHNRGPYCTYRKGHEGPCSWDV